MSTETGRPKKPPEQGIVGYRRLPLVELIRRIVDDSDHAALAEFHELRHPFRCSGGQPLRFTEYLNELRHRARTWQRSGRSAYVLDGAYDLTLDKFSRLPLDDGPHHTRDSRSISLPKRNGTDCRRYFSAFLAHVDKHLQNCLGRVEQELACARWLEVFVVRHYRLSCLECDRRSRPLARRYARRINGRILCVWMPSHMDAAECRTWLEAHVSDLDPSRPEERKRVQRIIDDQLGTRHLFRFSELGSDPDQFPAKQDVVPPSVPDDLTTKGLAEAVAHEKAESIDRQRPAIRRMGPQRLEQMIRRIFDDMGAGVHSDIAIARDFGLSKPTYSRFAGSRWRQSPRRAAEGMIPDLWRNTAQVLACYPTFTEAAKEAGVWGVIRQSLDDGPGVQSSRGESIREALSTMPASP